MEPRKRKAVLRVISAVAAIVLGCPILVYVGRFYGPRAWNDLHLVNFIVAWLPAVFSILVAFVPDKDLEKRMRIAWRIVLISCGVLYSVFLWHQQTLTDTANAASERQAVTDAVTQANRHSDERFRGVDNEIGKVQNQVQDVGHQLKTATGDIDSNIKSVGKPEPPELAKLEFSLPKDGMLEAEYPIKETTVDLHNDGTFQVRFLIKNISHVQAETVEYWVFICDLCSYAKEPAGFDNPSGNPKTVRHRMIAGLNPGVTFSENVLDLKLDRATLPPRNLYNLELSFRSTCKNCGALGKPSTLILHLNPVQAAIFQPVNSN
jgi:hypothetical protein